MVMGAGSSLSLADEAGVVPFLLWHQLARSLMAVSTRYPPCEQWLAAVVAGAGSSVRFLLF
jgi:hypothetical protein